MSSKSSPWERCYGVLPSARGTLAMDLVWYARYRRTDGEDGFVDWEFSASIKSWEHAGALAQVGKRGDGGPPPNRSSPTRPRR